MKQSLEFSKEQRFHNASIHTSRSTTAQGEMLQEVASGRPGTDGELEVAERGPGPEGGWPGPLQTHSAQPRGHSPASCWSKSPLTTLRTQGPLPPWEELRGRHASGRGRLVTQCSDTRDSLATPRRGYKDGRPFYLVAGLKENKSQVHGVPDEAKSKADLRVEGSGGGAPPTRSASGHGEARQHRERKRPQHQRREKEDSPGCPHSTGRPERTRPASPALTLLEQLSPQRAGGGEGVRGGTERAER